MQAYDIYEPCDDSCIKHWSISLCFFFVLLTGQILRATHTEGQTRF